MRAVPPSEAYTVSTIVAPTGTVVRRSSTPNRWCSRWCGEGRCCLICPSSSGIISPPTNKPFSKSVQRVSVGGVVHARKTDLVLLSRGRMGHFEGYAYLPALVPHGVDIQTLRP